jgi:hypothetical protein
MEESGTVVDHVLSPRPSLQGEKTHRELGGLGNFVTP